MYVKHRNLKMFISPRFKKMQYLEKKTDVQYVLTLMFDNNRLIHLNI